MSATIEEIRNAYISILCRQADKLGLNTYLNSGKSIENIRDDIRNSKEYKERILPLFEKLNESKGKKKILLFGAYGNGNLGDAIQPFFLKKGLIDSGFDGDIWANSYLNNNFIFDRKLPSWAINSSDILNSFDLIIIGGGGLFSHPHYPLGDTNWINSIKTKVAIFAVGATNFAVSESRELLEKAFYISARDSVSFECLSLFRSDVNYVMDPVFCLNDLKSVENNFFDRTLWILKGPLEKVHYKIRNYIKETDFVVGFEKNVDCQIEELFPEIVYVSTIEGFNKLAQQCTNFFCMRYHGLIASLAFSNNVFGYGDQKIGSLLDSIGGGDRYLSLADVENLYSRKFSNTFDRIEIIEKSKINFLKNIKYLLGTL